MAKVAVETPTTINVHTGFYEYLFKKDDTGRVRLEHILADDKNLLKKNKGYRLYCTGHSLGGESLQAPNALGVQLADNR